MTRKHHPQGSGGRTTSQSHTPTAQHRPSSSCWPKGAESAKVRGVAASSNILSALFLSDSGALCLSVCLSVRVFDPRQQEVAAPGHTAATSRGRPQ